MSLADFKGPDWKPSTEGGIGRPKAVARSRARTHRSTWRELHARKGGSCRLCGDPRYELHHLLSKARGGPNEAWNLCPLCPYHHGLVTDEDPATLRLLASKLLDDEYAGLVEACGEGVLERLFGVRYGPAISRPTISAVYREYRARRRSLLQPVELTGTDGSNTPPLPCGHPESAVVQGGEGTAYCGECAGVAR